MSVIKILLSSIFIFHFSWANECLLSVALKDPKISSDANFWKDYGDLESQGKASDEEVKKLIQKYTGKAPTTSNKTTNTPPVPTTRLDVKDRATKELQSLPKNLKEKVDTFLETALAPGGLDSIRQNPGRWHLEKVIEHGNHAYTVRLNAGYRLLFDMNTKDGSLVLRRVNKGQIHGN